MVVYFTSEPAMPERCRNVSRGLNTVTLTWEDPLKANGILKSYKVRDRKRLPKSGILKSYKVMDGKWLPTNTILKSYKIGDHKHLPSSGIMKSYKVQVGSG